MKETQKEKIKNILREKGKHCSVEIIERCPYLIDYRKCISDIRDELEPKGWTIKSEPCRGRCGRNHNASVFWYWAEKIDTDSPKIDKINPLIAPVDVLEPKRDKSPILAQKTLVGLNFQKPKLKKWTG